jgi:CDP-glycerol glycerophosphotransferase (TagB/SpsB family)/glycosyltransferase involved in cell wall biosynthesis
LPRFSVIVPVYLVQAYLQDCLESVLDQSFPDFELIAVDDCSPDACGALVDEFAARDSRVTAVHLPENAGLGRARNAGLERATGDYLIFLDSDDILVPGALRAIAERLDETSEPEILIYDYARTHWSGKVARNARAELLAQRDPPVFRLADRPALLRLLMVVWNKAYRRDFVQRHGLSFPPGFYEDTPWTFPALLTAESIAVLDRVCVHYRQRRQGHILGTTSRRHFDIFDQYDRVFAFLDGRPDLAHWRPLVFQRMLDHLTTVFTTRGRLPRGCRAEFFRRSSHYHRRYHAGGLPAPNGRAALRYLLMRLGSRRCFQLLWAVERLRARTGERAAPAYGTLRAAVLRVHYRIQRRLPVDDRLAVFAAYWNGGYACNPAAIEAKVRQFAPHIRTVWVTTEEHAQTLPEGVRRIDPGSPAFWTVLARARYLVNNVNFPHRWVKRPGQVHLQTHHGTPLKKMGLDLQDHPAAGGGVDFGRLLQRVDRWDYSLSASRHSTLVWERVYPAGYTTLEYGYPRNDIFQRATAEDVLRARARLGIPPGSTAFLYAPTFRDYRRGHRPRLDLARVCGALGPGFTLLVRHHYLRDAAPALDPLPDRVLDVSDHPSVEQLCLASDALITDYSSLMFDYANLDRPIVVFADDWEIYRAARGVCLDLLAFPPGPVAASEDELIGVMTSSAWHGSQSAELRAAFRARFCPYDDGRAAERVVRRVFLGENTDLPAVIPLDERRPAPAAGRTRTGPAAGPRSLTST